MTFFTTNFDEWEKNLRPCDLLLFSVKASSSNCIRLIENIHLKKDNSTWTHAGVVCPQHFITFKNMKQEDSYVLESLVSGFDGIMNIETNKMHSGLQIRNLKDVVKMVVDDGGLVACFRLKKEIFQYPVTDERRMSEEQLQSYVENHEYTELVRSYWNDFKNTTYDFCNVTRAVGFFIPCLVSNVREKRLFCSEAVVRLYQRMRLIDENMDSELISPEELGVWCNNTIGNSPFFKDPYILYKNDDQICLREKL